jgi:conjugal transfer pilus assembly protein TraE
MKWIEAKGQLKQLSQKLNYAVMVSVLSLLSTIILSLITGYTVLHEKRVVTPFNANTTYTVSDSGADANYLDMMSIDLLDARFNVNPETVMENNTLLLSYVTSSQYAAFAQKLNREAKVVQHDKLSSVFYRDVIQSDAKRLITVVKGTLHSWVGYRELPAMKKTYCLTYRYHFGRLTLYALEDITHEKP